MKSGASDPFAEDSQSQSTETDAEDGEESTKSVTTTTDHHSVTKQERTGDSEENKKGIEGTKADHHEREFSQDQLPYIL